MAIKVISNESIPQFEQRVNELLSKGAKIIACGMHADACWAILEITSRQEQ